MLHDNPREGKTCLCFGKYCEHYKSDVNPTKLGDYLNANKPHDFAIMVAREDGEEVTVTSDGKTWLMDANKPYDFASIGKGDVNKP